MQYALLYNKKDSKYHIYKSTRKDINIEKLEYIYYRNENIYLDTNCLDENIKKGKPIYIDIKINKYPLCNEDIKMNDFNRFEKHTLTFTPKEEYRNKLYNPKLYYYLYKYKFNNRKEAAYIYAERKVIMIFSSLFQSKNEMCHECFLEFIREACNENGSNIR